MRFHYSCSQNLKAWKSVEKSKTSKFESLRDVRDVLIKLQKNKGTPYIVVYPNVHVYSVFVAKNMNIL